MSWESVILRIQKTNLQTRLRDLRDLIWTFVGHLWIHRTDNKGMDESDFMHRMIKSFINRIWHNDLFLLFWLHYVKTFWLICQVCQVSLTFGKLLFWLSGKTDTADILQTVAGKPLHTVLIITMKLQGFWSLLRVVCWKSCADFFFVNKSSGKTLPAICFKSANILHTAFCWED